MVGGIASFVVALMFRGWRLGKPATYVFDETYYVNDALDLAIHGVEKTFVGHPPLGKWLISLGFLTGHYTPFSWRVMALVAGALVVAMAYALAARLSNSIVVGVAAALLVLMDGIANTTGRFALLDGFAALFTTAALSVLVFTIGKPLRIATVALVGGLSGAAMATKWTATPVLIVAALVCWWRARHDVTRRRAVALAAVFGCVAAGVYIASYAPWIVGGSSSGNCTVRACESSIAARLVQVPSIQWKMLRAESQLGRRGSQLAPGWRWLLQDEPAILFDERCNGGDDGVCSPNSRTRLLVLAKGNVVLWMLTPPLLGIWAVRRARRRAVTAGVGLIAAWAVALWLPWVAFSKTYTFYAAPIVPALAVGMVLACRDVLPRRLQPIMLVCGLVSAMVVFSDSHAALPWTL